MQKKPNVIEVITGSPIVEAGLTVAAAGVAAVAGGTAATVLLPALPVLTKIPAAMRAHARTVTQLEEIQRDLLRHEDQLADLTDAQFQVISDMVLAAMQTTQASKLEFLRNAVENVFHQPDLLHDASVIVGRIIRDLSADEAAFLIKAFAFDGFAVADFQAKEDGQGRSLLSVRPDSAEAVVANGVIALGLASIPESTWDFQIYRWNALAAKVIALIKPPKP